MLYVTITGSVQVLFQTAVGLHQHSSELSHELTQQVAPQSRLVASFATVATGSVRNISINIITTLS